MDRELTAQQRRRPWLALAGKSLAAIAVLLLVGWGAGQMLRPAVALSSIRIAVVERGDLEASVFSSGVIVPRTDQTVSSPVSAEIVAVHVSPGETVTEGQLLIELDTTASALALDNFDEQLALRRAEIRSVDLQHTDAIRQAQSRQELLEIDLESRKVRLARLEQLTDTGIVSATELLEAELNVKRTEVELRQVTAQIVSLEERRKADLERLELDYSIQDKQRADQARRVEMSAVRATRDGTVTFLVQDEGAVVAEGQALATISADDAFRVEASVSDFYGPQLRPNQVVRINSATNEFSGRLSRILSVAQSNRLDLYIELDDPTAPSFHSNLSVDIEIITGRRHDVLKARRGPALDDGGTANVFVIEGDVAVRKPVRLGISERREVEIVDGLEVGDRIIISDTAAFEQLERVHIK